jgi:hypothetical protein
MIFSPIWFDSGDDSPVFLPRDCLYETQSGGRRRLISFNHRMLDIRLSGGDRIAKNSTHCEPSARMPKKSRDIFIIDSLTLSPFSWLFRIAHSRGVPYEHGCASIHTFGHL